MLHNWRVLGILSLAVQQPKTAESQAAGWQWPWPSHLLPEKSFQSAVSSSISSFIYIIKPSPIMSISVSESPQFFASIGIKFPEHGGSIGWCPPPSPAAWRGFGAGYQRKTSRTLSLPLSRVWSLPSKTSKEIKHIGVLFVI